MCNDLFIYCYIIDVSGEDVGPIFKDQAVQEEWLGQLDPRRRDRYSDPKHRQPTTNRRRVTSQKGEGLDHTAAEAWNLAWFRIVIDQTITMIQCHLNNPRTVQECTTCTLSLVIRAVGGAVQDAKRNNHWPQQPYWRTDSVSWTSGWWHCSCGYHQPPGPPSFCSRFRLSCCSTGFSSASRISPLLRDAAPVSILPPRRPLIRRSFPPWNQQESRLWNQQLICRLNTCSSSISWSKWRTCCRRDTALRVGRLFWTGSSAALTRRRWRKSLPRAACNHDACSYCVCVYTEFIRRDGCSDWLAGTFPVVHSKLTVNHSKETRFRGLKV